MFKIICIIVLSAIVIEAHKPLEQNLRQYFTPSATPTASTGGGGLSGGSGGTSSGGSAAGIASVLLPFGTFGGGGPAVPNVCQDTCKRNGNTTLDCSRMCTGCVMTCGITPDPSDAICLARCQRAYAILCDRVCSGCILTC